MQWLNVKIKVINNINNYITIILKIKQMKRIFILLLLAFSSFVNAQIYTPINNYGQTHQRFKVTQNLKIPYGSNFARNTNDLSVGDIYIYLKSDTSAFSFFDGIRFKTFVDSLSVNNDSTFFWKWGRKEFLSKAFDPSTLSYVDTIYNNIDTVFFTKKGTTYSFLVPKTDTSGLSFRINQKLNISDTTLMLVPYKHWLANYTPQTRTIATTLPLQGGGDLSVDRTLSIDTANVNYISRPRADSTFWRNGGNSFGTTSSIGTNNNQDLIFKANNIEIGRYAVGTLGWDFGFNSTATGAHAFNTGQNGIASNLNSFNTGLNGTASGQYSFNTGVGGRATSSYSFNTGQNGLASGFYSTNTALNGTASGFYSFNAGRSGVTSNSDAVNFGVSATCSGISSFNIGISSTVSGNNSFNSGASGTVSGFRAINLGFSSSISGQSAFNSGAESTVSANYGINLGRQGTVNGLNGFNSGHQGRADGDFSFNTAIGGNAFSYGEHSIGTFPTLYTPSSTTAWVATDRLFNIGNGVVGNTNNAFTILKNGNTFILGKVSQPTTPNSPKGYATLVNGTVTISNTLATTGCFITVNYRTGVTPTTTTSILVVTNVTNSTSFTVTAYNAGAVTTNTSDNNQIEYTISN